MSKRLQIKIQTIFNRINENYSSFPVSLFDVIKQTNNNFNKTIKLISGKKINEDTYDSITEFQLLLISQSRIINNSNIPQLKDFFKDIKLFYNKLLNYMTLYIHISSVYQMFPKRRNNIDLIISDFIEIINHIMLYENPNNVNVDIVSIPNYNTYIYPYLNEIVRKLEDLLINIKYNNLSNILTIIKMLQKHIKSFNSDEYLFIITHFINNELKKLLKLIHYKLKHSISMTSSKAQSLSFSSKSSKSSSRRAKSL